MRTSRTHRGTRQYIGTLEPAQLKPAETREGVKTVRHAPLVEHGYPVRMGRASDIAYREAGAPTETVDLRQGRSRRCIFVPETV